ncbi:MAG: hypothetical protein LBD31_07420 [Treponema sp.]|jgi:hypothetical protein|nr:hypothetical protein [Treponema sp.]
MNDIISSGELTKRALRAAGGIAGGIVLTILGALPLVFAAAAGGILGILGIGALASKDPGDVFPGAVCLGAGILGILAKLPLLGGLAGKALVLGALALLGMGIWNGVKFILGLKSRSRAAGE